MIELTSESAVTVAFSGELETHNWEEFREAIIEAAVDEISTVVLDLGNVTFFDSSAIRALLGARLELQPRQVVIAIGPCSPIVHRVLELTGLFEYFPTTST